jgi:type II secretory pathway pseudopilin PulG
LTLLEVVVVLAIVALAARIALPRLAAVRASRVEAAGRRLAEAATLLRERAILGGAPAALVVDAARGRWTAGDVESAALPAGVRFRAVSAPGAATTADGALRLELDPAGDALPARFELVDDDGRVASVVVPPGGGRATVEVP